MQHRRTVLSMIAVPLLLAATMVAAHAATLKTLVNFDVTNGANPLYVALVQGTDGNLYGTTHAGGAHNTGTVFKVTPAGTLTTIYTFCTLTKCADGEFPNAGLALGANGTFYGTTEYGGANSDGTVFSITSAGKLTTLHSFSAAPDDGEYPIAPLIRASNGIFYGTTEQGGSDGYGTIYSITSGGSFTVLHSFVPAHGAYPYAGLVQASNGTFYGTTGGGGSTGLGTVFSFTSAGTLTTLHTFAGSDGEVPNAAPIQATNGIVYGTTSLGGANNAGTVFSITSSGTFKLLHSFDFTDGNYPDAALIQATNGLLYGTTSSGGANSGGTVFSITSAGTVTTLHSFTGYPVDGSDVTGGLVQATNGTLYGITNGGGAKGDGTIFSLGVGLGAFAEIQPTSGKENTKITILGQGFSSSSVVKFGGTKATAVVLSGTTLITATVPAGALTGNVTVTTGTTTLTSSKTFKVLPTITSFTPSSGPVGTSVTITGTGLKQTTQVTFDGKAATLTVISDTEVKADVPAGAATGKIVVTTGGGNATSATSFTVN